MFLVTVVAALNTLLPVSITSFRFVEQDVSLTNVFLAVIILGCAVTVIRRLSRVSRTLRKLDSK
jgi:hypothetical protein